MPTFDQILEFLSKYALGDDDIKIFENESHDKIKNNDIINRRQESKVSCKSRSNNLQSYVGTQAQAQCPICHQNHAIYTCSKFLQLNERERSNAARKAKLCLNCLRGNHAINQCFVQGCKKCDRNHNTLLHFQKANNTQIQNF